MLVEGWRLGRVDPVVLGREGTNQGIRLGVGAAVPVRLACLTPRSMLAGVDAFSTFRAGAGDPKVTRFPLHRWPTLVV